MRREERARSKARGRMGEGDGKWGRKRGVKKVFAVPLEQANIREVV